VLTGAVRRASGRSLIDRCAVSGQVPGSGARRQGQGLDEVSTAIHGDAVAMNMKITGSAGVFSGWNLACQMCRPLMFFYGEKDRAALFKPVFNY
jgi:hypothetical protein